MYIYLHSLLYAEKQYAYMFILTLTKDNFMKINI
jgi:hypothetical protein